MLAPSTNIILDTCSILNMVNGNILSTICSLPYSFLIGPIVLDECTKQSCPELVNEIEGSRITLLNGSSLPVSTFTTLSSQYGLGDGETECIGYAKTFTYHMCTDDQTARSASERELSKQRVFGSLRLIKDTAQRGIIDCNDAFGVYSKMKAMGGFLPKLQSNHFCI
jgi:predicted nucleic acid-binding protein